MRLRIVLFCFLIFPCLASAQKVSYAGMQQFSYLFSNIDRETRISVVNGLRMNHFFTGLGFDLKLSNATSAYTGFYNVADVYADGRYYFGKNRHFFVKVDQGFTFFPSKFPETNFERYRGKYGYYAATSIGFKSKLGNDVSYCFDISGAFRQTRYERDYYDNFIRRNWTTEKYNIQQYFLIISLGLEVF